MENKNVIYNRIDDKITPIIGTSHKDFAMDALNRRHQKNLQMQQEAIDAMNRRHQKNLQLKKEYMLNDLPITYTPEGYTIDEYGESEKKGKAR